MMIGITCSHIIVDASIIAEILRLKLFDYWRSVVIFVKMRKQWHFFPLEAAKTLVEIVVYK